MSRASLVMLSVLLALAGCKRLKTGAREHFATKYSCPEDRVTVKERDDLHYGDLVLADQHPEPPPDEVKRDPGRFAKWEEDQRAQREERRTSLNSNIDLYEATGCQHHALLGCRHGGGGDEGMDMGVVDCNDAPTPGKR